MMNTVRTYRIGDGLPTRMPIGARVLTAAYLRGLPVLYALIDPDEAQETERLFIVFSTFTEHEGHLSYISTLTTEGGAVWHIFEAHP